MPVRKNKKAAVRRNIRILVPSSDQDRGPDFPNQRISYSTREEFWVSEVGKKPDFPTFRLCYIVTGLRTKELGAEFGVEREKNIHSKIVPGSGS